MGKFITKGMRSQSKANSLPTRGLFAKGKTGQRFRRNITPAIRAHTPAITLAREKLTPNSIKPVIMR